MHHYRDGIGEKNEAIMTNKEALNILKDRKIAYEVVITRTASHENRHMAEEELKLINACIIALEHMRKKDA